MTETSLQDSSAVKTRVVFVDDEADVLASLRASLRKQRQHYQLRFFQDPKEALADLAENDADIVVSDMRMPGFDGPQFLKAVQELNPCIIRLALSGQADGDQILRALPYVHQWLSKPCPREHLLDTLERAREASRLITNPNVVGVVGDVTHLPSLPARYAELRDVLRRPDLGIDPLADIVAEDPAMSAKVLQVVNSAFFGQPRRIISVREAVMVLGSELVSRMMLSHQVFGAFKADEPEGFTFSACAQAALLTAELAEAFMQTCGSAGQAEVAATAGLLHEVGRLALVLNAPELVEESIALSRTEGISLDTAERELSGVDHAAIGATLLATWGLPLDVVEAVALHHHRDLLPREAFDSATAVRLASELAEAALRGAELSEDDAARWDRYLEFLGAGGHLGGWQAKALERARAMESVQ